MKTMKTTNKRRFFNKLLYFFLATAFMFSAACSPEDGRDGRDGINGINGTNGNDGEPGEQGEPGEDGNVNVQVSDWFPIQFDHVDLTLEYARMHIEIQNSQEFIDNGGIAMMFLKQEYPNSDDFGITPLPYGTGPLYLYFVFGNHTDAYGFEGFVFYASWLEGDITDLENDEFTLRYVLIPGDEGKSTNVYSEMSYEEIINQFDLNK